MKKIILLALTLTVGFSTVQGQTMKEKLAAKQKALADKMKAKNAPPSEFESLSVVAKNWTDGEYTMRTNNGGMLQGLGAKSVKFTKGENGEITNIKVHEMDYPMWKVPGTEYVMRYGKNDRNLIYINGATIVQYRMINGMSVYVEAIVGEKIGLGKAKTEIEAFRTNAKENVASDQAATAVAEEEERKKNAAARLAKYGLEGKDVKSIEIINLNVPSGFGHFSEFTYGVKAILKDGSEITTAYGEGYIEDYDISYGDSKYNGYKLESGFDADDKITISVKLKYDASIKTAKDVSIPYGNDDMGWVWNGEGWSGSHGKSANDFKIEIKQVKHAVTGAILMKIRVTNLTTGNVVDEVKMDREKPFVMYCRGGNGGSRDGEGKNAGNGGDVTLIKDPNVEYHNFSYKNNGGKAGRGTKFNGSAGTDGKFKEETRAVNF